MIILTAILNYTIFFEKQSLTKNDKIQVLKRRLHPGLNPDRSRGKRSTYHHATEVKCNFRSKHKDLTIRCFSQNCFQVKIAITLELYKIAWWNFSLSNCVIDKNEINGQMTQKLNEREFSFLSMTHILIWAISKSVTYPLPKIDDRRDYLNHKDQFTNEILIKDLQQHFSLLECGVFRIYSPEILSSTLEVQCYFPWFY